MERLGLSLPQFRRLAAVLVVAIGAVGTNAALASQQMNAPVGDFKITAEFHDAGAILKGSEVKVDGVKVGEVSRLTLADGVGQVVMSLDGSVAPVYENAQVTIRPVSLLGERYVDLDRGTPDAAPLPDGGVIPASQNRRTVDLDEVLSTVDEPTGVALAALVTTLGDGLTGNGEDVAAALDTLAPALTDTRALVRLLDEQTTVLNSLIDRLGPVTSALGTDRGRRLDGLVQSASNLLSATAAEEANLSATLERLPSTLASAQAALSGLGRVATTATPTLQALRPLTRDLTGVSQELERLAGALDPALASLDPVLDQGMALIQQARPVVADLRAAGGDLRQVAASARPIVEELDANLDSVLDFIRNWALVTNGSDGVSHYFRAHVLANPDIASGPVPAELPGAGPFDTSSGPSGLPLPTGPVTDALDGTVPSPSVSDQGSATGLTEQQERALLDYLLGGSGR